MLTTEQRYVLSLLRKSLGLSGDCTTPENLTAIPAMIIRNGILLTVYPTIKSLEEETRWLETVLRPHYLAAIKQAVLQDYEGEMALKALSEAELDCIALKGWEMRKYYPEQYMRQMADLDILVRPYEFNKIKPVMEELEYTAGNESSWKHDSFMKNEVHVEMHKRLTDDSAEIQVWEKEMWSRAVPHQGNVYKMSSEDYYIFHFVHLHKDFMNGSLGLRRIADTWLLQKQPVDMGFVRAELEKFGMWRFHERMVKLSKAVMGEEKMDEDSEILLIHAFTHGIYGSEKSYKAGRIAAMGESVKAGKLKSMLAAVFLPYKRMKAQFPILEKWPVLLPYCWLKRIVGFLKGDMKKNRARLDYSTIDEADYNEMKRFFEAGGV